MRPSCNREIPFGLGFLQRAYDKSLLEEGFRNSAQTELLSASTIGFYYLLRIGELAGIRMRDIRLIIDEDGVLFLLRLLSSSKEISTTMDHIKR